MQAAAPEADCLSLIAASDGAAIASCTVDGDAEASYAPVLQQDGLFYVYVSGLAKHTGNLLRSRQGSLLFLGDAAGNPFARPRASVSCTVAEIGRDDPRYVELLDGLEHRFGKVIGLLRNLPDFRLLALTPIRYHYIAGFGQAYSFTANPNEPAPSD
ncbi:pyridoxamine 5'-phosphate oxidase family protein [Methylomonas sp. SURF-1]|uniref:Pyridoxamine 5'-phosphate oxidase family protein n=1 Tax=Methylomonas aurea TaxID=2952224 RepID=A0ABT1UME0_9GAMM|nr:pyridoxamine 5'-phosphate oxidase family protein [Methylomonas sp. SURF-1]MCQ8182825.1 pyridoxamine 5'-phosphate oxidase family protein [Methylomonas sp. SURF-1]